MHGKESGRNYNISEKMIEPAFQKYNVSQKRTWDAKETLAGVKNRTSDFNCKNRKKNCIKTKKLLHHYLRLGTSFPALLSDRKKTSVCSRYGQKSASRSKRTWRVPAGLMQC